MKSVVYSIDEEQTESGTAPWLQFLEVPMIERQTTPIIELDPSFPIADTREIACRLGASGVLVPGFIPPKVGLLHFEALIYASYVERARIVILPDRNIASRMARAARDEIIAPVDGPTQAAIDLMALAQVMNFDIEPSIAFHELAHFEGNLVANDELRWFRAADHGQAKAWIDLALGRSRRLSAIVPGLSTELDLAMPLHRYRCNYAVALRVAALELDTGKIPRERAEALFDWMISDFIVAGPAAIFAAMYLSPRASRAGMIKQLRSPDRARALAGVRNAAWDITHLSEFTRHAKAADYELTRFIFATSDRILAQLGHLLFAETEHLSELERSLAAAIAPWWATDAASVAKSISNAIAIAEQRTPREAPISVDDYIGHQIALGEHAVTNWTPDQPLGQQLSITS